MRSSVTAGQNSRSEPSRPSFAGFDDSLTRNDLLAFERVRARPHCTINGPMAEVVSTELRRWTPCTIGCVVGGLAFGLFACARPPTAPGPVGLVSVIVA